MRKIILIGLLVIFTLIIGSEEIKDELWLKAVQLKSQSMDVYPTQTKFSSVTKDKKGNVQQEEVVTISHAERDGSIINSLAEAYNSEGPLTEENESVKKYLGMDVLSKDEGVFKSETSEDFTLQRLDNEILEGTEYAKYKISMLTDGEKKKVESDGFIWLELETGIPHKLSLEIDLNQMMIKSLNSNTYYSLSETGFLQTDQVVTDVAISVLFKKMFVTQTITREKYLKLN